VSSHPTRLSLCAEAHPWPRFQRDFNTSADRLVNDN
jgi:hypothetical protein